MTLLKSEEHAIVKGDKAPSFSLPNVDGQTVSLDQFAGKPVAVIFMCNHCPYVKPKMEEIGELKKEFEGKAAIVCINSNDAINYPEDSPDNMKVVAKTFGYDYYLYDESQEVAGSYGAVCTPDPFVFDSEHKLVFHGRINNAMSPNDTATEHDLKNALQATLDGKEIDPWFNPSRGCSIKWKS